MLQHTRGTVGSEDARVQIEFRALRSRLLLSTHRKKDCRSNLAAVA